MQILILNSAGRDATLATNVKFYCGLEKGSYVSKEGNSGPSKRVPCHKDHGVNCASCMRLDVTIRDLPYGYLVNGAGRVCRPTLCTHDGATPQSTTRPTLCRRDTCRNTPKYSCGMSNGGGMGSGETCTAEKRCDDCKAITYVFYLQKPWTKMVTYYYCPVWE